MLFLPRMTLYSYIDITHRLTFTGSGSVVSAIVAGVVVVVDIGAVVVTGVVLLLLRLLLCRGGGRFCSECWTGRRTLELSTPQK